jgi:CRP-like cAMP-binding protein
MGRNAGDSTGPCLDTRRHHKNEWAALEPEDIALFNQNVVCREYRMGQTIFLQDDPCRGLYFVETGLIAVRKANDEGRSAIVRLAHAGDTLGYRPLLARENHRATAEVIVKARVCFLKAAAMLHLLKRNPNLGMRFLECTAKALGEAEERMYQIAALSVRTRIIHLLLLLSNHYGSTAGSGQLVMKLPMTRRHLASMVGAQPESVSRAFRDLQAEGHISSSGRTLRIDRFNSLVDELHLNLH